MDHRGAALIRALALAPHPEGGHYREIFRSAATVAPADGRGERRGLTAIHFLLAAGDFSRWHRLRSDEVWVHLEGDGIRLWLLDTAPPVLREVALGAPAAGGVALQVIPAGTWQAAEPLGAYGLAACLVAPGFEFSDEAYMDGDAEAQRLLRERWPELARLG
jgi:predicted cupin superfamily sugar epimerase